MLMEIDDPIPVATPVVVHDPRHLIERLGARFLGISESSPRVSLVASDPPIYVVRDFLSPEECLKLREEATPGLKRSVVVDAVGGISPSMTRTSSSCYLRKADTLWLGDRIARLLGHPIEAQEPPQV